MKIWWPRQEVAVLECRSPELPGCPIFGGSRDQRYSVLTSGSGGLRWPRGGLVIGLIALELWRYLSSEVELCSYARCFRFCGKHWVKSIFRIHNVVLPSSCILFHSKSSALSAAMRLYMTAIALTLEPLPIKLEALEDAHFLRNCVQTWRFHSLWVGLAWNTLYFDISNYLPSFIFRSQLDLICISSHWDSHSTGSLSTKPITWEISYSSSPKC